MNTDPIIFDRLLAKRIQEHQENHIPLPNWFHSKGASFGAIYEHMQKPPYT